MEEELVFLGVEEKGDVAEVELVFLGGWVEERGDEEEEVLVFLGSWVEGRADVAEVELLRISLLWEPDGGLSGAGLARGRAGAWEGVDGGLDFSRPSSGGEDSGTTDRGNVHEYRMRDDMVPRSEDSGFRRREEGSI